MIKKSMQNIVYDLCARNADVIYKEIKRAQVISFDIFDTLIKRNVPKPEDIFSVVELLYDTKNRVKSDYCNKRIKAENVARSQIDREINLDDIYNYYVGNESVEGLKSLEIDTEIKFCVPNYSIIEIFNRCIKDGKTVYLISDMYHTSETIQKILDKCGVTGYNKLYVSCDENKTKARGDLFLHVKKENNIKGEWIHIGDSIRGDYTNPRRIGIKSILIRRKTDRKLLVKQYDSLSSKQLVSFITNKEPVEYNYYQKIGYEILGPILCGFSSWLNGRLRDNKGKVLFLARDSKLLLEAYKILYEGNTEDFIYFYISRKASLNCVLDLINSYDEMIELLVPKDADRIFDLYEAFNIPEERRKEINSSLGINEDIYIHDKDNGINKERLFDVLKKEVSTASLEQRTLLKEYLNEQGVGKDFSVVDIGWEGRTQWAFQRLNQSEGGNVKGLYFGIIKKYPKLTEKLEMSAYLGSLKNTDRIARVIMETVAFFETLFLSDEGSTIGYEKGADGHVIPKRKSADQNEGNLKIVKMIQGAALQFVKDIKESQCLVDTISWDSELIMKIYEDYTLNPSTEMIRKLRGIQFVDKDRRTLGAKHNILYYVFHLSEFHKDIAKSLYRVFFLKDVFKISMPYFDMLYKFYSIKHR